MLICHLQTTTNIPETLAWVTGCLETFHFVISVPFFIDGLKKMTEITGWA